MAQPATVLRLKVQLSDSDRAVYESLDLRLAQHPSETDAYLVTRVLAYCLAYEEGIAFSHGLSHADEPALWVKSPDGRTLTWIEVGSPSPERLHRASKACPRVMVFCHHDPQLFLREIQKAPPHRAEAIALYVPDSALVRALSSQLARAMQWEVVHTGGQVYVTTGGQTFEGELTRLSLV